MRRTFAWALSALAFAGAIPSAWAQSYGYPQYPAYGYQQYPAYGYAPAPAYRVMPTQYYPAPAQGGNYYGQTMAPAYRYIPRPAYVPSQPSYMVNTPGNSAPPSQPMVITQEPGSGSPNQPAPPFVAPMPSANGPTLNPPYIPPMPSANGPTNPPYIPPVPLTNGPITSSPLPYIPATSGPVSESCNGSCGPDCQPNSGACGPACQPYPAYPQYPAYPVYQAPPPHYPASVRAAAGDDHDRDPEPKCYWMAGGGAMVLRTYHANNTAFTTLPGAGLVSPAVGVNTDFNRDWEAAPYGWIAFVGSHGLGVRARYWHLKEESSAFLVNDNPFALVTTPGLGIVSPSAGVFGGAADSLTVTNKLRLNVGDLEAICQLNEGPWSFLVASGARWTEMEQTRFGRISNPLGFGGSAISTQDFRGIGPTVALEASRSFGKHFALYVNGRGSALFGTHRLNQSGFALGGVGVSSETSDNDIMPVFEMEAGVQCSCVIHHCNLVLRAGFTGQTWIDAGSSVDRKGNLDLVGGILQFGFAY